MAFNEFLADRIRQAFKDKGIDMEDDLAEWIQLCLDYNPKAKASRKKSEH